MAVKGNASLSRDLARYVPAKVVPALLGFLVIVLLSRRLPAAAYGSYAALLAVARLADSLGFAWLRQSILRFRPEAASSGEEAEFKCLLSLLLLVIVGVEAALVFLCSVALQHGVVRAALAAGLVVSMTPYTFAATIVQAERAAGTYAGGALIQSVVQTAWVGLFVFLAHRGEAWALLGVLAGLAAGTAYLVGASRGAVWSRPLPLARVDLGRVKVLCGYGLPVALSVLGFQLVNQGNRLLLFALGSAESAGVFASAYDLINGSLSLLMTPFLLAAHPAIMEARLRAGGAARRGVEEILSSVSRHLLMIFLPVLFLATVLRGYVFAPLGPGYGVEGWVVPVLVTGAFVGQFAMYAHKGLEIADRTTTILRITAATGLLNLGLNALLIPHYSYFAVAIVSLLTHTAYFAVASMLSRRHAALRIPWPPVRRFAAAVAFSGLVFPAARAAVAATGAPAEAALLVGTLAFGSTYLAVLAWWGELPASLLARPGAVPRVPAREGGVGR